MIRKSLQTNFLGSKTASIGTVVISPMITENNTSYPNLGSVVKFYEDSKNVTHYFVIASKGHLPATQGSAWAIAWLLHGTHPLRWVAGKYPFRVPHEMENYIFAILMKNWTNEPSFGYGLLFSVIIAKITSVGSYPNQLYEGGLTGCLRLSSVLKRLMLTCRSREKVR